MITRTISSLELCREYRNTNIYMLDLEKLRGKISHKIRSNTATLYLSNFRSGKDLFQGKIYEKTYTLLRIEYTLLKIPFFNNIEADKFLYEMLSKCELYFNIDESFIFRYDYHTDFILYRELLDLDEVEFAYLLSTELYVFNKDKKSQQFRRKLQRKKLLSPFDKKGIYQASEKLKQVKTIFNSYFSSHVEDIDLTLDFEEKMSEEPLIDFYDDN